MSNQFAIPFKKTYATNIKQAAHDYLQDQTDAHPDAFKRDINLWEALRKDTVGDLEVIHVDRIPALLRCACSFCKIFESHIHSA